MVIRGRAASLALSLLLCAGVTACQSSDDNTQAAPSTETVDGNCAGALDENAVAAAAALIDATRVRTSTASGGMTGAAKALVSEYRKNGISEGSKIGVCWIYRSSKDLSDITVSFSFATQIPDAKKTASVFTPYKMGALALAGNQSAALYMRCTSSEFDPDGSKESFLIRGETRNRYEPDGNDVAVQKRNLTVAHSVSFAMAKALRCENNAGLSGAFEMPSKA
ncbi:MULTISPECIES: hypothetical protein [unclassified Streptomyces]|uniref:hypothetical protein n=1 Tax=unclassified Streptomyces TaxID=2593676 RepID=UPI003D731A98